MRLGYCCINLTLGAKKPPVYTGRSLTRRLFSIKKASTLAAQNIADLLAILEWNRQNGIFVFRITSDLFPRLTDPDCGYRIKELNASPKIIHNLHMIGAYAQKHKMQLSFHPGPFALLGSPHDQANIAGTREIEAHACIAEHICAGGHLDIPINVHIGGTYNGDFERTASRWLKNFAKLSQTARERLTLENDDRLNGWSIRRLHRLIYSRSGVPLTIDLHHFLFCHDKYPLGEDYRLAKSTWGHRSNEVHYSESAAGRTARAHSDYLQRALPDFVIQDQDAHVLLEAKAKELALLKYRIRFKIRETRK